jgi:hypothetical protein
MPYTTDELIRGKSKLKNELDFDSTSFIKEAQARIDTKLRRRYKVPFADPVPDLVESIATNFAAGFAIERDYSNRPDKNEPYLAEVLIKRAENDLEDILDKGLLDGMVGVEYALVAPVEPAELARPAIMSTTPRRSPMERALSQW